jgi:hypothetical protein
MLANTKYTESIHDMWKIYQNFLRMLIPFLIGMGAMYALAANKIITPVPIINAFRSPDYIETNTNYQFISPLLFCQDQDAGGVTNKVTNIISDAVEAYISNEKNNDGLIDAGVYFKDLNNGPWAGVNSSFASVPASLLKVPTAISVFEHEEEKPGFVSQKIMFGTSTNVDQTEHFQPLEQIQAGHTYSVEDLVRYMLVDSDNAALYLLGNLIPEQDLFESYDNLGIKAPTTSDKKYTVTPVIFASFFRVLYNASYLNRSDSEHLLSVLSHSAFTQGLVAGLPRGVTVSHKFGESLQGDGSKYLNDCGIIYKPHQPYLLCIMTKGNDFDKLSKNISGISKIVWDTLDKNSQ